MSRLHLLAITGLLASSGLLASRGLLASGGLWQRAVVAAQRRKARSRAEPQDRSTRQSSSFFAPDRSYPATPEIKLVPQLLFHPQSKELAIGNERAEGKYNKHCCAAATVGAQPRSGGFEVSLTTTALGAKQALPRASG